MTVPNILTFLRIAMVFWIMYFILKSRLLAALVLFSVAGLTDMADGIIARIWKQKSALGSFLDPAADKLLLSSSFLALGMIGLMPIWVVVLVLLRDLLILGGLAVLFFTARETDVRPSFLGKFTTGAQGSLVVLVLGAKTIYEVPPLTIFTLVVTVIATVLSGGYYFFSALRVVRGSPGAIKPF